ncbi:hypothetical protein L2E82_30836 [Cichorium intybus]|uniref:Uncharacterized protein n=1 Tax=Cichorium intybus TaxID=13427 RepID=A0ACB9D1C8_CICIN|nr:hypothetical protein L2E82_30836 [Cichorium intybus]
MSSDTITIGEALGEKVGKFIQLATTFVGGLLISFIRGWRLSLVVSLCMPLMVVAGGYMSFVISKTSAIVQSTYAEAGNVVEETVRGIRTVASFNGEKHSINNYDDRLEVAYSATCRQGLASGLGTAGCLLVSRCSYGLAIWYGSKLILQEKDYNGGEVITIILAMTIGALYSEVLKGHESSLGQTTPCLSAFAEGRAAAYTMFETINRKPKIYAYNRNGIVLEDIKGEIELKEVHFSYPARSNVQILSGFSLHIPSGMTAALVGPSGNGKSTVITLLQRFYDPDVGEVLIDDVNLKQFQLKWIRSKMALVSQEPVLFTTTIKENIVYGKENATDEEIEAAIAIAYASDFINKLPQRLDTMVDEATSALDAESEREVQKALDAVTATRTTVVIAHRLSTIRNADIIAVVHGGKLLEKGNHEELMKDPKGAYPQLVQMQSANSHQAEEKEVVAEKELAHIQQISSHESSAKRLSANNRSSGHLLCPTNVQDMGTVRDHKEEMAARERVKRIPVKRIAYLNKPELLVLFLGSIAAVAHGLLVPIYGLILSSAIKIFYEPPNKLQKDTKFWALMFVGLGFCSLIFVPLQNYLFGVAGGKLIQRIRSLSFQKIVHQEMSWFDKPEHSSGAINARLATDASIVRNVVGDALALVVQNLATITGGLVIAFTANWILALVMLALLPLISMQGFIQMKFYKGINANSKVMYEEASQVASDAVGSIRTVSSFSAEEKVIDMYQKKCEQPIKQAVKTGIVCGAGFGFSSFTFLSVTSLCFYTGSVLQQHGRITFAEIFRVFFCLSTLSSGLSQAATLFSDMNKARESIASIFEILDSKPKIDSSLESGMSMDSVKGDIELQHVSFKYPSRPDFQVFKDLSLTIASGKTVAVVGESGSGKSTIIGLIERFYDPDSGGKLSGGQKQRIAIARAILKHPKVLLLDEATSALDAESEHVVQDALDKVMVGRTSIVVAHRLSTIKGADIIAVVKNGVIAEKGTHDELLKISGGVYASLVSLQTASA